MNDHVLGTAPSVEKAPNTAGCGSTCRTRRNAECVGGEPMPVGRQGAHANWFRLQWVPVISTPASEQGRVTSGWHALVHTHFGTTRYCSSICAPGLGATGWEGRVGAPMQETWTSPLRLSIHLMRAAKLTLRECCDGHGWCLASKKFCQIHISFPCPLLYPQRGISLECEEGETEHEAGMERRGVATG